MKVNIFKNKSKKTEKHPDYQGSIRVGEKYYNIIALWINEDKNGNKYFSGNINTDDLDEYRKISSQKINEVKKVSRKTESDEDVINPDDLPF